MPQQLCSSGVVTRTVRAVSRMISGQHYHHRRHRRRCCCCQPSILSCGQRFMRSGNVRSFVRPLTPSGDFAAKNHLALQAGARDARKPTRGGACRTNSRPKADERTNILLAPRALVGGGACRLRDRATRVDRISLSVFGCAVRQAETFNKRTDRGIQTNSSAITSEQRVRMAPNIVSARGLLLAQPALALRFEIGRRSTLFVARLNCRQLASEVSRLPDERA